MTELQTRQLGIEFERRVQTMIPESEYLTKLDTETIYSYLNQYQDKLIHDLYKTIDQIPVSNAESYIETLLQDMLSSINVPYVSNPNSDVISYSLPNNFGLYIDSYSSIKNTYEYKGEGSSGIVPNTLISIKDVNKVFPRPQDNMRILRNPIVWLMENDLGGTKKLGVIYDKYTTPKSIHVDYYRIPKYMNPLTSQACELPMEMFEPLVSGAVDLYVQYVAGAEARKRQMAEQQRQQQQKRNNKEDE